MFLVVALLLKFMLWFSDGGPCCNERVNCHLQNALCKMGTHLHSLHASFSHQDRFLLYFCYNHNSRDLANQNVF